MELQTKALLITLLFTVHPLHVECVSWISGRKFAMMGFFFFLSLYMHILNYEIIAYVSYILACLTQPGAVVLPLVMLFTDYCFYSMDWALFIVYVIPSVLLLFYFIFKTKFYFWDFPHGKMTSCFQSTHIFLQYLIDFIAPSRLCARYGAFIPNRYKWVWFTMVIVMLAVFLIFFEKNTIFYGIGFYLICFLPVNGAFPPLRATKGDRFVYLGSFGLCLVAGAYINFWVIAFMIILACRQNMKWTNDVAVWENAYGIAQTSISRNNLGCAYQKFNMVDHAEFMWNWMLRHDTQKINGWDNLIRLFSRYWKIPQKANLYLNLAIKTVPHMKEHFLNIFHNREHSKKEEKK